MTSVVAMSQNVPLLSENLVKQRNLSDYKKFIGQKLVVVSPHVILYSADLQTQETQPFVFKSTNGRKERTITNCI